MRSCVLRSTASSQTTVNNSGSDVTLQPTSGSTDAGYNVVTNAPPNDTKEGVTATPHVKETHPHPVENVSEVS